MNQDKDSLSTVRIESLIFNIRRKKVILDSSLANLYGVTTSHGGRRYILRVFTEHGALEKKLSARLDTHEKAILSILQEMKRLTLQPEPIVIPGKKAKMGFAKV